MAQQQPTSNPITIRSLEKISELFYKDFFLMYEKNESKFDHESVHGVMHISRSLVLGYIIAKELENRKVKNIDIDAILFAIAFHDSGRRGNNVDYWENDSKNNCINYMKENGYPNAEAAGSYILKDNVNSINHKIVYDVDVIEIIRCRTLQYFNPSYLQMLPELEEFYGQIIFEWNMLIHKTSIDVIKNKIWSRAAVSQMIAYINNQKYPKLNEYL